MKASVFFSYIHIDSYSATPKYLQLCNSILDAVRQGKIPQEEILPSINELSYELEISRDTAEKSYKYLKGLGVLGSVPGKGYFVASDHFRQDLRIFLLFNKLSAHKKIVMPLRRPSVKRRPLIFISTTTTIPCLSACWKSAREITPIT